MALALLKSYSLSGIAEGWTEDCKILYKSVRYAELKALQSIKDTVSNDETAAVDEIVKFCQEHFVSGKGMTLAKDGNAVLSDLKATDLAELPVEVLADLFSDMTGASKSDPKESKTSLTPSSTVA